MEQDPLNVISEASNDELQVIKHELEYEENEEDIEHFQEHQAAKVKEEICEAEFPESSNTLGVFIKDEVEQDIPKTRGDLDDFMVSVDEIKNELKESEDNLEKSHIGSVEEQKNCESLKRRKAIRHKCDQCNYETTRINSFNRHFILHEMSCEVLSGNEFKCNFCDYRSAARSNIIRHCESHKRSSIVNVYKCDQCDYQATRKSSFTRHLMKHEMPCEPAHFPEIPKKEHKCNLCDYRTFRKTCMTRHALAHEKRRNVNVYKCEQCDYQDNFKAGLTAHYLIHINPEKTIEYKCDQCVYQTTKKTNFASHYNRMHRKEDVYKCDKCYFKTPYKHNFEVHNRIHKKYEQSITKDA